MLFTLEPLQAAEGDCLLLHWGTAAQPRLAVIDGGPGRVYEDSLKPRLRALSIARDQRPLQIDLAMVSHMDSDHIVGIKKMFREMVRSIENNTPPPQRALKVNRLWHNVFNDILNDAPDQYYNTLTASFLASVNGAPNPQITERIAQAFVDRHAASAADAAFEAESISHILASHGEGRVLRDDQEFLHQHNATATLNSPFSVNGKPSLISTDPTDHPLQINGLDIQVFGPRRSEIDALQKEFDAYIKANHLSAESVLAAYADKSAKNLSSIVCLCAFGDGAQRRKMLFTGDARGDNIIAAMEAAGALGADPVLLDVLKVPHHGSSRNVAADFFERIHADHYVFSGDGDYANPDRETLEWLIKARGKNAVFHLHFTYPIVEIDKVRKTVYAKKGQVWTQATEALETLLADRLGKGFKFKVYEGPGLKIELGDESL